VGSKGNREEGWSSGRQDGKKESNKQKKIRQKEIKNEEEKWRNK
jgi:hypothetical protein